MKIFPIRTFSTYFSPFLPFCFFPIFKISVFVFSAFSLIISYLILPETEGVSLEDIEIHFSDNNRKLTDLNIAHQSSKAKEICWKSTKPELTCEFTFVWTCIIYFIQFDSFENCSFSYIIHKLIIQRCYLGFTIIMNISLCLINFRVNTQRNISIVFCM